MEPGEKAQDRLRRQEITRSKSATELATLYRELYGEELEDLEITFKEFEGVFDEQQRGRWRATEREEGAVQSTGKEIKSRRGKEDIVHTDVSDDQLREEGFEIVNFEDGTVCAEVQFYHQVITPRLPQVIITVLH